MNIIKGLYFPGTMARGAAFNSLLCLLDQIDYYLVVEDDQDQPGDSGANSYWQGQVVAPLGEEREKFLAMIRDIRLYGAQYYENCLARLSADGGLDSDETSARQLAARVKEGKAGGSEKLPSAKLWQARVVLRLAEILEEEKTEIDRGLAAVKRNEMNVFRGLKGEDEDSKEDDLFSYGGPEVIGSKPVNFDKALPAWGVLHTVDSQDHPFLVTDNAAAAAVLFDVTEAMAGEEVQLLVAIDLPWVGSAEDLAESRAELAENRRPIAEALRKIMAGGGAAGLVQLQEAAGLWQKNIEKKNRPGGSTFSLYLLPGDYSGKMWEKISGVVLEKSWPPQILVGVLGESA
ncbi:MAG: hypothetical protein ABFQ82_00745 [Thermodesulfobacteriota bacterium]